MTVLYYLSYNHVSSSLRFSIVAMLMYSPAACHI